MAFPVITGYSSDTISDAEKSSVYPLTLPTTISSGDTLLLLLSVDGGESDVYFPSIYAYSLNYWHIIYSSPLSSSYNSRFIIANNTANGGGNDQCFLSIRYSIGLSARTISYIILRISGTSKAIYASLDYVLSPYNIASYINTNTSIWQLPQCPASLMTTSDDYLYILGLSAGICNPSMSGSLYTEYLKVPGTSETPMTYAASVSSTLGTIPGPSIGMGSSTSGFAVALKIYPEIMDPINEPTTTGFGIYTLRGGVGKV